jgi:quercetin 2,3-dioxygenase
MAIITYLNEEQAEGYSDNQDLFEKKPVGFYSDDGLLSPYSNIFYWSRIWTVTGAEITDHSYKGFEILIFVLSGRIEYYDSKYKGWKSLSAGDLFFIRSGNGIINSLRLSPDSSFIQIWTDPNLEKSLNQPAISQSFPSESFPLSIENNRSVKIYKGKGSPVVMQTEGLVIMEVSMAAGTHVLECKKDIFLSGFVIEGDLRIRASTLTSNDFFIAKEEEAINISTETDCRLLVAESPLEPGYPTYAGNYRF